jgi:hypothetical protein
VTVGGATPATFAEIVVDLSMLRSALSDPRRFFLAQRVRLPFRFDPRPTYEELDVLSVSMEVYRDPTRRRDALLLWGAAVQFALEGSGALEAWVEFLRHPQVVRARRDSGDVWKLLVLRAVIEPSDPEEVRRYFAGEETLADAFARTIQVTLRHRGERDRFAALLLGERRFDRHSAEFWARLRAEELRKAELLADNAAFYEAYTVVALALIGILALGPVVVLEALGLPGGAIIEAAGLSGALAGEGFGIMAGAGAPLMTAIFGGFMGFIGYVRYAGRIAEDGEITEEEVGVGHYAALAGIFLPVLDVSPRTVQAVLGAPLAVAALAADVLDLAARALAGWLQLLEHMEATEAAAAEGIRGLVGVGDGEIYLPPT